MTAAAMTPVTRQLADVLWRYVTSPGRRPGRLRQLPILGPLPAWGTDPETFYDKLATHMPTDTVDIGRFPFFPGRNFVSWDLAVVRDLYRVDATHLTKPSFMKQMVEGLFGSGIITADGESWKRQRDLSHRAFNGAGMRLMFDAMRARTEALLVGSGGPCELTAFLAGVTLQNLLGALLGAELEGAEVDALVEATSTYLDVSPGRIVNKMLLPRVPTPSNRRCWAAEATFRRTALRMIRDARARRHGLVWLMSEAPNEHLVGAITTLLLAGHETTAGTLTWLVYHLHRDPGLLAEVQGEVDAVMEAPEGLSAEALEGMTTLSRCVDETLRLHPPSLAVLREALEPVSLGPLELQRHDRVFVPLKVLHTDERYWEAPDRFDPSRFAPEEAKRRSRYAYLPFGHGARVCVGRLLGLRETRLVATVLLHRFRVRPEVDTLSPVLGSPVHRPGPFPVTLERRRP